MMQDEPELGLDVSRETLDRLHVYAELLRKWNPVINLVARGTLDHLWSRHFRDSAQICHHVGDINGTWADLGSGGGFPGLVIAAIAAERHPDARFTLVESDRRKATFLSQAARAMGLDVDIRVERIETLAPLGADFVSARALAPLTDLLGYAERHLRPGGRAVFPKGKSVGDEIEAALASWRFEVQIMPSQTNPEAVVLILGDIARVGSDSPQGA